MCQTTSWLSEQSADCWVTCRLIGPRSQSLVPSSDSRSRKKHVKEKFYLLLKYCICEHRGEGHGVYTVQPYYRFWLVLLNRMGAQASPCFNPWASPRCPVTCSLIFVPSYTEITSVLQVALGLIWPLSCSMTMWWPLVWTQTNICPTTGPKLSECDNNCTPVCFFLFPPLLLFVDEAITR